MQVPSVLPRIVVHPRLTDKTGCSGVILLEEIIERNIGRLFLKLRCDLRPSATGSCGMRT